MGAATWTLQIISTSCFRAHPRQSTESFPVKKKKNDKRLDRNGSFSTSFAKQVRVIPSMWKSVLLAREKKQYFPNQEFELTLILKNMGQLCEMMIARRAGKGLRLSLDAIRFQRFLLRKNGTDGNKSTCSGRGGPGSSRWQPPSYK